jgi:hypothetical protein
MHELFALKMREKTPMHELFALKKPSKTAEVAAAEVALGEVAAADVALGEVALVVAFVVAHQHPPP